ncbi:hypothetical protein BaRGS_00009738 [Batillaria attramentaria]|uniref:Uncharacterized protein n=1 Tax=Batillaria attramentaria TaxID=370345 RepID=A0ABD0LH58_9CAEN
MVRGFWVKDENPTETRLRRYCVKDPTRTRLPRRTVTETVWCCPTLIVREDSLNKDDVPRLPVEKRYGGLWQLTETSGE